VERKSRHREGTDMLRSQSETDARASLSGQPRQDSAERREFQRVKLEFEAFVQMDGQKLRVGGVDAHGAGARITATQALPPGALVLFHIDSEGFAAWASVRRCNKVGRRYEIGLEFLVPRRASSADSEPWG
jgi:hypothetical protein